MSGKRIILDSNIVIALFGKEESVLTKLEEHIVYIPSIVLGELYYGSYKSDKKEKNIIQIDELSIEANILQVDRHTSKHYGKLKSFLKKNGAPNPENDVWIAALASQHQMPIATRDKHFRHLEGLVDSIRW